MTLTPDDIVNHDFKQRLRGYDVEAVDAFLDRVADQIEANDRELADLRSRLREAESRLAEALETESTLKRTLVTAQDAAQRALDDAREQADELRATAERRVTEQLEEARAEAQRLVADGHREREQLLASLEELRSVEEHHRVGLRDHLEGILTALDELERVPEPEQADGEMDAAVPASDAPTVDGDDAAPGSDPALPDPLSPPTEGGSGSDADAGDMEQGDTGDGDDGERDTDLFGSEQRPSTPGEPPPPPGATEQQRADLTVRVHER